MITMRFNFNMTPDPKSGARLVTGGPYRLIRHPMYTALLLITAALLAESYSLFRLVAWLMLFVDLAVKLHYEESLLLQRYPEYTSYLTHSKRLIPFLY